MLKALLKKEFSEIWKGYFYDRKKGKMRAPAGIFGMIIFGISIFCMVAFLFVGLGMGLLPVISAFPWLYFSIAALLSILLGVFGSVFNTYAGLYLAKDNDLLLSMPIPPSKLLFSKISVVFSTGLLYTALCWIPMSVVAILFGAWNRADRILVLFAMLLLLSVLVTVLTCLLGFGIAILSVRLKNKAFVTTALTLVFIILYYVVYFRVMKELENIASMIGILEETFRGKLHISTLMGNAASGDGISLLIFAAATILLFAATYLILSKTFLFIATMKIGNRTEKKQRGAGKQNSLSSALFKKEWKRFSSSSIYLLNNGLGILIMPALAVYLLIKRADFTEALRLLCDSVSFPLERILPFIGFLILWFILQMDAISGSSISMEGKNLWILQSLPVRTEEILSAKRKFHFWMNLPSTLILAVVASVVLPMDDSAMVVFVLLSVFLLRFLADWGLFCNLRHPMLNWTNETVPVKQSSAAALSLFGTFPIALVVSAIGGAVAWLYPQVSLGIAMLPTLVLLLLSDRFLSRWVMTTGCRIFEEL